MHMKRTVDPQLIRDILGAFGFAEARIDVAVHDLFADSVEQVPAQPVDRVLTFKQACDLLSLSKSGLRRLMQAGRIRPINLSARRIGFRQTDIAAFIESRAAPTATHNSEPTA